ncbi:MAG: M20 family peptidase [Pseudomonadota bacterium]
MWRWIGGAIALVLLVLAGVVGYRTATFATPQPAFVTTPDLSRYAFDANAAAQHLGQAIRFRTVSLTGATSDEPAQFTQFHDWLARTYPAFYAAAKPEVINGNGLLFRWTGSDPSLPPMLLLAHQDVVPVADDTRSAWRYDPFGGEIHDGAIWGRGAVDDKGSLIGLLEAADLLAKQGLKPKRTIIFAFGFDEEISGRQGATQLAATLKARGVRAWFALDEGLAILESHPLTGHRAALIGVAEKGFGTLRLTARAEAGHSSMPPHDTAISLLAEAVTRVHAMPIEHRLDGPTLAMMQALAPQLSPTNRMALANEWLFDPLLQQKFAETPAANASAGTTVAPTVITGGVRENVLPLEATALINLRIHPRDRAADLLARARQAVAGLQGVTVEWNAPPDEASPVSRADTDSFTLIASLSHALVPDAPVAPSLVIGATDSRLYADVAENVYRFQPIIYTPEELEMIHGVNEHISIANLERMIRFYAGLMQAGAM